MRQKIIVIFLFVTLINIIFFMPAQIILVYKNNNMYHNQIITKKISNIWEIGNSGTKDLLEKNIFLNSEIDYKRLILHTIIITIVFVFMYLLITLRRKNESCCIHQSEYRRTSE